MSTFRNEQKENTKYPVTMSEFDLTDLRENKNSKYEDACMCCGACGLICLLLGLVGAYITWLVFSIIGMTEVSDQTLREVYHRAQATRENLEQDKTPPDELIENSPSTSYVEVEEY